VKAMPTALSAISEDSSIDARLSARTSSRGNDEDHSGYTAVSIRVRPLDPSRGTAGSLTIDSGRGEIWRGKEKFAFASVFGDGENNEQLFEVVGRPLVDSVMLGYNGTILAYGQTGSGKTYTIGEIPYLGTPHEGVAHRMVRDLFNEMAEDRNHKYEVSMQFVQIHLEKIYDLLVAETREYGKAVRAAASTAACRAASTPARHRRQHAIATSCRCTRRCNCARASRACSSRAGRRCRAAARRRPSTT
jgi:hypothetical protein